MAQKKADGDDGTTKMTRDNILLRRPKKVTLLNGRTFYAKYEMVSCKNLPRNITFRRTRTIGRQKQRRQREVGMISGLFTTGLKFGSKFLNSAIRQKIAEDGIKQIPHNYNTGVSRVSNQILKRALESDLANYAVKKTQDQIHYNWENV